MAIKINDRKKRTIRPIFITGLITVLPIYISYIFFSWVMKFLHRRLNFIPHKLFPDNPYLIILFEILLFSTILVLIYLIGLLATKYIGRQLLKIGERFLNRIPLIRTIYTGSKQILESFMLKNKKKFLGVVMVEYPRKGSYVLGFITDTIKVKGKHNKNLLSVFIPSTPTPTTGFLVFFKKSDVVPLTISPEAALKMVISGGIAGTNTLTTKD
ncbi:MAG: DUF502 domain-containing protein [Spirochaetes bacterium]|nr:DUF502 domain-containing protein [Spirochaetota bacterium]